MDGNEDGPKKPSEITTNVDEEWIKKITETRIPGSAGPLQISASVHDSVCTIMPMKFKPYPKGVLPESKATRSVHYLFPEEVAQIEAAIRMRSLEIPTLLQPGVNWEKIELCSVYMRNDKNPEICLEFYLPGFLPIECKSPLPFNNETELLYSYIKTKKGSKSQIVRGTKITWHVPGKVGEGSKLHEETGIKDFKILTFFKWGFQ